MIALFFVIFIFLRHGEQLIIDPEKVNESNLEQMLQQYRVYKDSIGDYKDYTLSASDVLYYAHLYDEVPKFIAFAVERGMHPMMLQINY